MRRFGGIYAPREAVTAARDHAVAISRIHGLVGLSETKRASDSLDQDSLAPRIFDHIDIA